MTSQVVTIDGPAGAGKSTIARALGRKSDFSYLDTGALYRVLTWFALSQGWSLKEEKQLVSGFESLTIRFSQDSRGHRVWVNDQDVTEELRTPEISRSIADLADQVAVRESINRWQRQFSSLGPMVTEGRDQGSCVFADARVKFFLNAELEERARRRQKDLARLGRDLDLEAVQSELKERDLRDQARDFGGLTCPHDAVVIDTTGRDIHSLLEEMAGIVQQAFPERFPA